MTTNWILITFMGIGLTSALVAGSFQAFSEFVMKALIQITPSAGIESMQMINKTVYKTGFLVMLLGLAPVTLCVAVYSYFNYAPSTTSHWVILGAFIYLIFVFLVTMLGNVPMNTRLEHMRISSPDTLSYWETYGKVWTLWNHVRTLGAIATSVCFLLAATSLS